MQCMLKHGMAELTFSIGPEILKQTLTNNNNIISYCAVKGSPTIYSTSLWPLRLQQLYVHFSIIDDFVFL